MTETQKDVPDTLFIEVTGAGLPEPNVVFVLGGPGAGKGTMCEVAEIQLGWTHLSTGDLLREEQEAGGPASEVIKEITAAGKLVPSGIVVRLLKDAMERITRTTGKRDFLIDGFPRSLANLEVWYEVFGRETELPMMLYFECPFPVLKQRILGRAKHSDRADDNIEAMKHRFDTFKEETLPTVELFKTMGKCVELDASQERETVYVRFREKLARFTDQQLMDRPLTEKAEKLLGLRPYSKDD